MQRQSSLPPSPTHPEWRTEVLPAPSYDNTTVVLEPYSYLLQVPGKAVRSKLIAAFNFWMDVPQDKVDAISHIVQMLHTASLLIDDIEDGSTLRRGIPTAHLVYGVPWAINCGNYVYFQAMEECTKLGNMEATQYFLSEMIRLHHGQGFEIYWRDSNICPTEEEYIRMVQDKTGGLFRLAIRLMSSFSEEDCSAFIPLVTKLGLYFQIRDDYINLVSTDYSAKKGYCEDLTEGKFSFPIIHCITNNSTDRRLLNILKQRTTDRDIKRYAVEYMRLSGSFEYTEQKLRSLMKEIHEDVSAFAPNEALNRILQALEHLGDEQLSAAPPALRLSSDHIQAD